jgi:putative spermidine/putrescine transport system ATP-binding protein
MPFLELRGVTKRFGNVVALDDVTLELEAGEFFSVLGPSGCGKSTALRIVAGFVVPDEGQVIVDGRDVTQTPPNRRDMGMVFQAYSLFPNMTARENVEFGLRIRGRRLEERTKRARELLELVGLAQLANRYAYQMSGGEQQRIALARALAIEPRVLLMDEPLSALDAHVRVQLREEIRRIQRQLGITALYVTHDQEEALSISDRLAVMSPGRPQQVGTPLEIYGEPATPFVAEFVGTMNRLESNVVDGRAGRLRWGATELTVKAARGRSDGSRVLVLVRPESVTLEPLPNGERPAGALSGRIVSTVFLGPVTRIKVGTDDGGELAADVSSASAERLLVGTRVIAHFSAEEARVLGLDGS